MLGGDLCDDAIAEGITEEFREISGIAKKPEEPCNWQMFLKVITFLIPSEDIIRGYHQIYPPPSPSDDFSKKQGGIFLNFS